jgi:alpha-L-rhamnosidase
MHILSSQNYTKQLVIILSSLLFLIASYSNGISNQIRTSDLRCEYLEEPLGIDIESPRFSWVAESPSRDVMQGAYRIVVSRDDRTFGSNNIVWDTGKVNSGLSLQQAYKGKRLESQTTYYWRVKVWDQHGQQSTWSAPRRFHTGFLGDDGFEASWIGASDANVRSPLLRSEFTAGKWIHSAWLYVTSIGLHEIYINGARVGDHLFDPPATQFSERLLYTVHDVSDLLNKGANVIGAWMGEGMGAFTEQSEGRFVNVNKDVSTFSRPKLLLEIRINYNDGTQDLVTSEGSWRWSGSAITFNNFFGGEDYDARLEQAEWSSPLFDDSHWNSVATFYYGGTLSASLIQPVRELSIYEPVSVLRRDVHTYEYDFGVTIGGYWEIEIEGKAGSSVMVRGTEKCGGPIYQKPLTEENQLYWEQNHTGAYYYRDCYSLYTLKGEGAEMYKPRFFYHGFRYLQVRLSDPEDMQIKAIKIIETNNALAEHGEFSSSDEYLNRIHRMVVQTFRNNFIQGIPLSNTNSEKYGWTGDVHLFSEAADYTFDMAAFWTKWVNDFPDAQKWAGESGNIPVVVPEMRRRTGTSAMVNDVSWLSVYPHLVNQLYMHHLDTSLIKKHYDPMKTYHSFVVGSTQDYIGTGIWGDHMIPSLQVESRGATLEMRRLINTAYLYRVTKTMEKLAGILGKKADQTLFREMAGSIYEVFNETFYNHQEGYYLDRPTPEGYFSELTSNLIALQMELVPVDVRPLILDFVRNKITSMDYRAFTGILGTWAYIDILRKEDKDLLYNIVMNRSYPGWGYFLEHLQASTLNQTWEGSGDYNHCMLGGINAFFYGDLLGIRIDFASNERLMVINPFFPVGLSEVSGKVNTPYGTVVSAWRNEGHQLTCQISIPANTRGAFVFPPIQSGQSMFVDGVQVVEGNKVANAIPDWIKSVDFGSNPEANRLVLGSGSYEIVISR